MKRHEQSGIALISTLIMLSLVTFLSVAFLTLTRQERATVQVQTQVVVAEEMERAGFQRATAEIVSRMLTTNGPSGRQLYDFMVSTNYQRIGPFDPSPPARFSLANVSYTNNLGGPLSMSDQRQNILNLFYDPRVPVYKDVNRNGSIDPREYGQEFIYYIDYNRNGMFEPSGLVQNTNGLGQMVGGQVYRMGDPHWIGVLDRPNLRHNGQNRFIGRYAFLVQPTGRSLDLNYIHNQARLLNTSEAPGNEGYVRNQGVGNWELNLAGFLVGLNGGAWNRPASPYSYSPFSASVSEAFGHARDLSRSRYQFIPSDPLSYDNLWRFTNQFGIRDQSFPSHLYFWNTVGHYDLYGNGPFNVGTSLQLGVTAGAPAVFSDTDDYALLQGAPTGVNEAWFGSPMPSPFFNMTELLQNDGSRIYDAFANRLRGHMASANHFDRYTLYRMMAQMGMDSAPPYTNKIHLNYLNWFPEYSTNYARPLHVAETNFYPWLQTDVRGSNVNYFFEFVADTLLKRRFGLSFKDTGPNNQNLATTIAIPVWDSAAGRNLYNSAVHQTLQLAANIHDAANGADLLEWNPSVAYAAGARILRNGLIYEALAASTGVIPEQDPVSWLLIPHRPSIFRPQFDVIRDAMGNVLRVQVTNYVQVVGGDTNFLVRPWLDLNIPAHRTALRDLLISDPVNGPNVNIYGVPMIVGAKKGMPNFNEFGLLSRVTVQRKIEVAKTLGATNSYRTNLMYTLGVTNRFAAEAWNSYTQAFPNGVQIHFRHAVHGRITNSAGTVLTNFGITNFPVTYNLGAGVWQGGAFIELTNRTATLMGDAHYVRSGIPSYFVPVGGLPTNRLFDRSGPQVFDSPDWHFTATHRMAFWIMDTNVTPPAVLDVVSLNDLNSYFDLTTELLNRTSLSGMWDTNRPGGTNDLRVPTFGVLEQLAYAGGYRGISPDEWDAFPNQTPTAEQAQRFRDFFNQQNTATNIQAPFAALRSLVSRTTWGANDPLVHYTREDLTDGNRPMQVEVIEPPQSPNVTNSFRGINERYSPWGGPRRPGNVFATNSEPEHLAFNLALKDPGVRWSDDWNFPTHKMGGIGWLGRVHRGTPWQTVYLKAHVAPSVPPGGLPDYSWARWAGRNETHPTNDWELMELFTTTPSSTAARGLLSINQTNTAAWHALFSGLLTLTNVVDDLLMGPTNANTLGWLALDPNNGGIQRIIDGIRRVRDAQPNRMFTNLSQILAVEELTAGGTNINNPVSPTNFAPVLNAGVRIDEYYSQQEQYGIPDTAYERLPQQVMSLLKIEDFPRLTVYGWGQSLKPARRSVVLTAGPARGLCTNYQVTAEVASKSVVRIEGVNPGITFATNNILLPENRLRGRFLNFPRDGVTPLPLDYATIDRLIDEPPVAFRLRHSQRTLGHINGTPVRLYPGFNPGDILPMYDPDYGGPMTPVGIVPGRVYYVVNARADDFQLSETPGGPPLDLTDYGIGFHRLMTIPKTVVESHNLIYPE